MRLRNGICGTGGQKERREGKGLVSWTVHFHTHSRTYARSRIRIRIACFI